MIHCQARLVFLRMDADHYDEFGNYIGPELDDTDSEEEIEEQESEMPLVPTGVEVEECFYDSHRNSSDNKLAIII